MLQAAIHLGFIIIHPLLSKVVEKRAINPCSEEIDMANENHFVDWDLLIAAGVPLFSSDRTHSAVEWTSVAEAAIKAVENQLTERENIALRSWMIALKDHYTTTFNQYFLDQKLIAFMDGKPIDGRHIKLRRIAASSLSKVA
jgi:hypothetical protein